tara:strand:- start:375 stop:563 length:189 start_codon:yes stop_codon:yes gene_type:complete
MFHCGYSVHAKIRNMKKDLYRFAKARANAKPRKYKQIKLTKKAFMFEEDEWYRKYNLNTNKA